MAWWIRLRLSLRLSPRRGLWSPGLYKGGKRGARLAPRSLVSPSLSPPRLWRLPLARLPPHWLLFQLLFQWLLPLLVKPLLQLVTLLS